MVDFITHFYMHILISTRRSIIVNHARAAQEQQGEPPSASDRITARLSTQHRRSILSQMFGGWVRRYSHDSQLLNCAMNFSAFFPPASSRTSKVPVLFYLSGLTCTDENVMQKSGIQRKAAELGLAIIAPDTSPRGLNIPGESDSWDFGLGAGFYLNATEDKWKYYRMYDYITLELPGVLSTIEGLDVDNCSIMGHSMGGHGALTISLKNPSKYKSVSAFAPICNPTQVPWGQKAFTGYLGSSNKDEWKQYDAVELLKDYHGPRIPVLMDTGADDDFLQAQLHPWKLEEAAAGKLDLVSRMQAGYDHSYFTIATFIDDHLEHHAEHLIK